LISVRLHERVMNMEIISKKTFQFVFTLSEETLMNPESGSDVPIGYLTSHEIVEHNSLENSVIRSLPKEDNFVI
jgi:hypothetical protein